MSTSGSAFPGFSIFGQIVFANCQILKRTDEASDGGVVAHGAASVEGESDADPLVLDVGVGGVVALGLKLELVSGLGPVGHHGAVLSVKTNVGLL